MVGFVARTGDTIFHRSRLHDELVGDVEFVVSEGTADEGAESCCAVAPRLHDEFAGEVDSVVREGTPDEGVEEPCCSTD
jgi:hypothetical protein